MPKKITIFNAIFIFNSANLEIHRSGEVKSTEHLKTKKKDRNLDQESEVSER